MRTIDCIDTYMRANNLKDVEVEINCGLEPGLLGRLRSSAGEPEQRDIEKITHAYPGLTLGSEEPIGEESLSSQSGSIEPIKELFHSYQRIASAMERIADASFNVSEANKIIAESNCELVHQVSRLMDELQELRHYQINIRNQSEHPISKVSDVTPGYEPSNN